jgi:hypothetical protein
VCDGHVLIWTLAAGHAAPAPWCECGIHARHPRRASARRVLASRREMAGIIEAGGAVEVHDEGFRAERARPRAFLLSPGRNPKQIGRLAATYRAEVVYPGGGRAFWRGAGSGSLVWPSPSSPSCSGRQG